MLNRSVVDTSLRYGAALTGFVAALLGELVTDRCLAGRQRLRAGDLRRLIRVFSVDSCRDGLERCEICFGDGS